MRALSLFSGIAGLDLAAHAAGIETVGFCEIEPFAVRILNKRFPGILVFDDVRKITKEVMPDGSPVDVVHGGFPCQDLSVAGKQRGLSGERSGLWFEMLRVVSELRPAYVLAENVRGACNLALPTVVSGLEGEGYEVRASVVPASAFGAPHKRERLFVLGVRRDVAYAYARLGIYSLEKIRARRATADRSSDGSGELWPTPSVHGNYNRRGLSETSGDGLATAVKMWATPSSADCKGSHGGGQGRSLRTDIHDLTRMWPTPRANKPEGYSSDNFRPTLAQCATGEKRPMHGQLSPLWVEILMGFPLGWTDPDCDEPEPWPGWPAGMGENQHPYEPPRTCTGIPNRTARLKCLGNAVVPQQAYPFFEAIAIMEEVRQCNTASST